MASYYLIRKLICKYNYTPHKNASLKLNINKINTQTNMKQ